MKRLMTGFVIAALCLGLFYSFTDFNNQAQAQGKKAPVEQKITVLNPLGTPPPIKLKPMAPRLNTLEGKTIYVVDEGYPGSDNLMMEITAWFERNMPKTRAIFKRMAGGAIPEDKALWAEIKQQGDAVIMGTGH